jgi:hypothetical protein
MMRPPTAGAVIASSAGLHDQAFLPTTMRLHGNAFLRHGRASRCQTREIASATSGTTSKFTTTMRITRGR